MFKDQVALLIVLVSLTIDGSKHFTGLRNVNPELVLILGCT